MAVRDIPALRDRTEVFRDREEAGRRLAELLASAGLEDAVICAIPAGGVPVAVALARETGLPLDVAVVSKITLPWNTEAGYGAVAFDGTTRIDEPFVRQVGLLPSQIDEGTAKTRAKVERRARRFRDGGPAPDVAGRTAILVDDGLASGRTMLVAIEAVRSAGAVRIVVAVPTGHSAAVERIAEDAEEVLCANIRGGHSFAVADAYERWTDVPEIVALEGLIGTRSR